jgi:hypothetical protein
MPSRLAELLDDPNAAFEAAAARTAEGVRPIGGRKEGKATALAGNARDALAKALMETVQFPGRFMEQGGSTEEALQWAAPMAMNMVGAPVTGISQPGATLGIVPVDVARRLNIKSNLPQNDVFQSAVRNTPGAKIEGDALQLGVTRRQHPDQEMSESIRGGVFYLPKGSKDQKYYTGTRENFSYGGTQKIEGDTAVKNPLFVKGATGGKAPEAAFDQLNGKGAYQAMREEALRSTGTYNYGLPNDIKVEATQRFLEKYAPELSSHADYILENTKKGNQMAYALQEAAVASAARRAGHDAVVGYSQSRKTKEPFISELFDVRENRYPSPSGEYSMWPEFIKLLQQDTKK